MNDWQRWLQAPQTLWLRRALFQVHLWLGIGFGLYLLVISVSGSAVVLRPQFSQWFTPSRVPSTAGEALRGQALEAKVAEVYSDAQVTTVAVSTIPGRAVYVAMTREGREYTRFFDPYTGTDLGETFPWPVRTMEWLVKLHDDLLLDRTGRQINGLGGMLLLLMLMTGLVLWWPGRAHWRNSLVIRRRSARSLFWQLHTVLGLWSLLLLLVWGLSAIYFAFPAPFEFIIDSFDADLYDAERPDGWLLLLLDLHFGRFGGLWGRLTWVVLGLLPAFMFITGFVLWWRRVVTGRLKEKWLRSSAP
ncbi:MAG: PepSY-associated TM helix domain-containing protein [Pseudomonadales bacterium]|nr:PepSY-associated TM helix domain-containing protein [Pseudomonadales bacterium]